VSTPCSTDQNTVCSACPNGKWSPGGLDRRCQQCSTCGANYFESEKCTSSTDAVCGDCADCPSGQYRNDACKDASDMSSCTDLTECVASETYQVTAPTAVSNRECAKVTVCPSGQVEESAPTITSDRSCVTVTNFGSCKAVKAAQRAAKTGTYELVSGARFRTNVPVAPPHSHRIHRSPIILPRTYLMRTYPMAFKDNSPPITLSPHPLQLLHFICTENVFDMNMIWISCRFH
jgi:hypothetical protein